MFLLPIVAEAKLNVEWLGQVYDFGVINETDGIQTGEFRLVNKGRKGVRITEVKPACGCTSVEYSRDKFLKGDTAVIKVRFDPTERPGKLDKGIKVYLNDEEEPSNLRIKGVVKASGETLKLFYPEEAGDLHFDTGELNFGEIKRGTRRREFLEIYNSGEEVIYPEFSSDTDALSWEINPGCVYPGESSTLTLYLESRKLMWLGEKEVTLRAKWEGTEVEIPVKVKLLP